MINVYINHAMAEERQFPYVLNSWQDMSIIIG